MAWAREYIAIAPHGSVFLADTFLAARGRQERTWQVMDGQVMITLLLKPTMLTEVTMPTLSMALSLGVLEPLESHGVCLKWPNDFLLNGKKLGGMLVEVVWDGIQPTAVIVGIGLNINTLFNAEHILFDRATSIAMNVGHSVDITSMQQDIFAGLNSWYDRWVNGNHERIIENWKIAQGLYGQTIKTHTKSGQIIIGIVHAFNADGSLSLDVQGVRTVVHHYAVEDYQAL